MRSFVLFFFLLMPTAVCLSAELESEFEQQIRPLLVANCIKCHGAAKQEGELRLDSRSGLLAGGASGSAIVPGSPSESLLIRALKHDGLEMPPEKSLATREVEAFVSWIRNGAVWPDNLPPLRTAANQIANEDRAWWSFQPIQPPNVPVDPSDNWSRNPIDRFVYQRLQQHSMRPAPMASPTLLVRRLYFDLLGLPPTPKQLDDFFKDDESVRWERLIDQLLSESAYGEHWARYWLDLVRFAESDGWKQDAYRLHIWRYRDYVVKSFNQDKPYPEFVREQLAGDELNPNNPDSLAATGYLRLGIYEYNQRNARAHWNDILNELTDVTGDVFLGMGMACARCHDHKFDPLLQTDYFRLRAFFEPMVWRDDRTYATDLEKTVFHRRDAAWQHATKSLRQQIDELVRPYQDRKQKATIDKFPLEIQACIQKPAEDRTSWEHQMVYLIERQFIEEGNSPLKSLSKDDQETYDQLQQKLVDFESLKPEALPNLMSVSDSRGSISPTVVPGGSTPISVEPGFLTVLETDAPNTVGTPHNSHTSGRRAALAEWIGHADNPLTSRVIVNRVWQQHFGQGIVKSVNDFGQLGDLPSHPELLDWLASQFVESGWSFKHLHKLILTSSTWRQAVEHPEAMRYEQIDPAENLLWRARVRRLNAEQIRDAMLTVSGELEIGVGGPSEDQNSSRRALYIKSFRNTPNELLHAFDQANGLKSEPQRNRTTTAVQSLLMINGEFTLERADAFARRVTADESLTANQAVNVAFRLAWGRLPDDHEREQALRFVGLETNARELSEHLDRWSDLCHVLLNSNEFLYVD
ncbi:MAG: PSD1 and planctomycete cytochrome C domain-containing protein [Pirellulaceae bacterium]|nr:PSD1 and planctomycete cytochrome C domain-containing protein [Pirellulaceae bacterium]